MHEILEEWINTFTSVRPLAHKGTFTSFIPGAIKLPKTNEKIQKSSENSQYSCQLKSEGTRKQSLPLMMQFNSLGVRVISWLSISRRRHKIFNLFTKMSWFWSKWYERGWVLSKHLIIFLQSMFLMKILRCFVLQWIPYTQYLLLFPSNPG